MSSSKAARIPAFAAIASRDRDKVLNNATERTYAPGATIVKEGERAINLFFIVEGHANVGTASEGPRATLGPGAFFGELGLIERHPRTATVTAEDELTVILVPAWEFRALLDDHPEMAVPMLYGLIERIHRMAPHEHHEHTDA